MSNMANDSLNQLMATYHEAQERYKAMTPTERAEFDQKAADERAAEEKAQRRIHAIQRLGGLGQFPEHLRAWYLKFARDPSPSLVTAIPGLRPMLPLKDQEKAMEMLKGWFLRAADNIYQSRGPWLIAPMGNGKTALLSAWANCLHAYVDRPLSILYVNWANIVAETESKGAHFEFDYRFNAMTQVDVLVLDEIGTFKDTSRSNLLGYKVLDHRYGLPNKLTAVSSNYGPDELKTETNFKPQSIDRLVGLCPKMYQCGWYGESLRENPPQQLELVK